MYKTMHNELMRELQGNNNTNAKQIICNYGSFCPNLQYIIYDALETKDYPNGISNNSIRIIFALDLKTKKVELHSTGHIWLSPSDKATDKYKYLAMISMKNVAENMGVKKFRKQGFKDFADLRKKMETYYNNVMQCVEKYTGGYPYKQGI